MSVAPVEISQPPVPDRLAGALLKHLQRRHHQVEIGGAGRALLGALLTFGLWPLIQWPRRLRDFVVIQQMQGGHLVDWMQEAVGAEASESLRIAVDRVRFRTWLWVLSLVAAGIMVTDFAVHIDRYGMAFGDILATTWGYERSPQTAGGPVQWLHLVWGGGLAAAYLLHWLQVKLHARDMRRVIAAFNDLAQREQLATVPPVTAHYRLVSMWTVGMVLLCLLEAWWGVAMMLAGSVQRELVNRSMPQVRLELSNTLRAMLHRRQPSMHIPTPVRMTRPCPNARCTHQVPADAGFCPRCGSPMNIRTLGTGG